MRGSITTWRLVLVLALLLLSWNSLAPRASGAAGRGLILLLDPATVAPGQPATLTVKLLDAAAKPVVGATLAIGGATVAGSVPATGATPLHLKVTPSGSGPIIVTASHPNFVSVSAQVPVVAPRVPAQVAALDPSLGILAEGVSVVRNAKLRDPLFFRWQAQTNPTQRGSLRFADGSVMDMDSNTQVLIKNPARTFLQTGRVFLQVVAGGQSHDVETGSTAVAASEGTRYQVWVNNGQTTVTVYTGRLSLRNAGQTVSVWTSYQSSFTPTSAPSTPRLVSLGQAPSWTAGLPVAQGAGAPTYIYLLRGAGHRLDIFSIDTRKVIRTIPLSAAGRDLALSRDDLDLFVGTDSGVVDVLVPNGAPRTLAGGLQAAALAALPNHQIAVADALSGSVLVLDSASGQTIRTIPLGYTPSGLAASPDGGLAVVDGAGEASLVDLAAGRVISTREVQGSTGQPSFAADGQFAYVPAPVAGTVLELSVAARGIIGQIGLSSSGPVGEWNASVAYGDGRVFVADTKGGAIDVLDPVGETVLARYPIGAHPMRLAMAPDGKLAITATAPSQLIILDPMDGAVLDRIPMSDPDLNPPLALSRHGMVSNPATQPWGTHIYAEQVGSSVAANEPVQTQPAQPHYQTTTTATAANTTTATPTPTATPTAIPGTSGGYGTPPLLEKSQPTTPPTMKPTVSPTQPPPPPTPTQCIAGSNNGCKPSQ